MQGYQVYSAYLACSSDWQTWGCELHCCSSSSQPRIAGIGVENLATSSDGQTKFRKKVMRVLHVIDENEGINPEALDRYSKLFDKPLSPSHIQALAALFGWSAPEVGEC